MDEYQALYAHAKGGNKILTSKRRPTSIRNLTPKRDSPTSIKNLTLQGDFRNIRGFKEEKNIYPLINSINVIRWDTLLRIFLPEGKNTIREITKDIVPMQLKMMNHSGS
jgi:hypothetical protein